MPGVGVGRGLPDWWVGDVIPCRNGKRSLTCCIGRLLAHSARGGRPRRAGVQSAHDLELAAAALAEADALQLPPLDVPAHLRHAARVLGLPNVRRPLFSVSAGATIGSGVFEQQEHGLTADCGC